MIVAGGLVERLRLVELLHHEDARVRQESARALERFFPGAVGIIPHLVAEALSRLAALARDFRRRYEALLDGDGRSAVYGWGG